MLEFLIDYLVADLAPTKVLIPSTLRGRLPHLMSGRFAHNDLRIHCGDVVDECGRTYWSQRIASPIALRSTGTMIYVLLEDGVEIDYSGNWSPCSDISSYLVRGYRPPHSLQREEERMAKRVKC